MKISFRSVLWILFFLVLALLAVVGTIYKRNFTGLGPIPLRSAFAGRLPSVPDSDGRLFRFFYATNRANNDTTFNERGNELAKSITTGTFDVRISPYMQIQPFVWFDEKSMEWKDRVELAEDKFQDQLRQAVQASPHKSVLVIVWGFRDWFQSAALKTAYTAYALDINTPVVLFDWPGNQGEGRHGYAASQQVATQSAPDLARTLSEISSATGAENIWLMGSSLGCQTICDALAESTEGKEALPKLSHVVLSAPDVSAEAFDDQFAKGILATSKHLTAYVSSNDRALLMSDWLNRGRRLGRKAQVMVPPEERTDQYEFEEALELLELQAKGARNITLVDATPINVLRNLHHFFTDSPVFFDDLYQRLLRPDEIVSRRLHSVRMREGTTYWILWND